MDRLDDGGRVMDGLDNARWAAVEARDEAAVGLFLYAARTTGIYCVPTCPSRRPARRNVVFFATGAEAVAAGFRACRRCRPDQERVTGASRAAVVAVCRRIEDPDEDSSVAELARQAGWSQRHLSRMFKDTVGVTISAYRRAQRGERVRNALRRGVPVTDAVLDAGYGSMRAFYDSAGSQMGVTPSAFGEGAPGACVRYTVFSSPLGEILVAATGRGVCAVRIGDSREALEVELADEFPQARVERSDETLEQVASIVRDLCRRPTRGRRRSPARSSGLDVPGRRVASAADHPGGNDRHLWRGRGQDRTTQFPPGGGPGLRRQPLCPSGAVPQGGAGRWIDSRLSLGQRAQARTPGRRVDRDASLDLDTCAQSSGWLSTSCMLASMNIAY